MIKTTTVTGLADNTHKHRTVLRKKKKKEKVEWAHTDGEPPRVSSMVQKLPHIAQTSASPCTHVDANVRANILHFLNLLMELIKIPQKSANKAKGEDRTMTRVDSRGVHN